jgi:ABC-type transport system involved in cytochrome c biogenesis permease subunit
MTALPVNLAFGLFLLALVLCGAARAGAPKAGDRMGTTALAAGALALTAALVLRWVESGRAPLSNQYESLLVLGWFLAAGGLWAGWGRQLAWSGLVAGTLAAAALAAASLFDPLPRPLMPALRSNWLIYHVVSVMASYAALAFAAAGSAIFLVSSRSGPDAERLEDMIYKATRIGFFLLSVGIATGAVWAERAWGSYWSWDPKETASLITWLIYGAYLHARTLRGWRGTRSAVLLLVGFLATLLTYFGNLFFGGLHSYAGL